MESNLKQAERLLPAINSFKSPLAELQRSRLLARCSTADARSLVSHKLATRLQVLPLTIIKHQPDAALLTVAVPNSFSLQQLQELRFAVSDFEIEIEKMDDAAGLSRAIESAYLANTLAVADCRSAPEFLQRLLEYAISLNSSDLHIELRAHGLSCRVRVDGLLRELNELPAEPALAKGVIRKLKVLARLDLTVEGFPQEGAFTEHFLDSSRRIRLSVIPTTYGEKAVLRFLDGDQAAQHNSSSESFAALGLTEEQERTLRAYLGLDSGSIIVAGPTGCGKSTLLYSILRSLVGAMRNLVTIEDPVECRIAGVTQTEVNNKQGLDYATLLPAILRQDPDVLMIGEIREARSAEVALTAGLTGHLVLSTIHAANALEAIVRLRQIGVSSELIAASVKLLISMRLVGVNCPACVRSEPPTEALREAFQLNAESTIRTSPGCEECGQSGIMGRVGVFEFLKVSDTLRSAMASAGGAAVELSTLRELARENGYLSYAVEVRRRMIGGEVSPSSTLRALGLSPELFGYS